MIYWSRPINGFMCSRALCVASADVVSPLLSLIVSDAECGSGHTYTSDHQCAEMTGSRGLQGALISFMLVTQALPLGKSCEEIAGRMDLQGVLRA
jgi:hypothetical protein